MNPVKVLKPGSRLICLRDLSNKRLRPSSALSSSFSSQSQTIVTGEKRTSQSSSSSSSTADADNDEGGGGGGGGEGGEGGGGEAEMKSVCVSKSPVPAVTPVGARSLSLRLVTSTVADCEISRIRKRDQEDSSNETSTSGAPLLTTTTSTSSSSSRSSSSSGKTTSTPSPNNATNNNNNGSLHQMAAAAGADDDAAGEDTTSSGQDSPAASPAKQLNKLKRFLKTIHHLGSDISVEIGELVRSLVLRLVNNNISIEEFHEKLHKATNFPLRPFVIPFLKSTLPILQQELLDQAELNRLSPHQYLARNEHLIFHTDERTSTTTSPPTTSSSSGNGPPSIGCLPVPESVGNGAKRRHSDRKPGTNGVGCIGDELSPAAKRPRTRPSPPLASDRPSSSEAGGGGGGGGGYVRIDAIPFGLGFAGSRPIVGQPHTSGAAAAAAAATRLLSSQLDRELIQRDRERYFSNYNCHSRPTFYPDSFDRPDDEWKYVEHLLKCIVGMVDKCQRALVVLQERSMRSRDELTTTNRIRRTVDSLAGQMDIKRYVSDFFSSHDFQPNEEQALRSAEESMKDFRLQAVVELQKAVAASEAKAREMLAADRVKMEQTLEEVRRKTRDEITCLLNKQEDSDENCWNCGRMASQTCSGCNVARYCGTFCQHRHWESHHRVCGRTTNVIASSSSATSSTSSAPHHEVLPRSTRLSSNHNHHHHHHHPARDQGSTHPGVAAPFRSRSRTKSLSPVLLQTTVIKQETL